MSSILSALERLPASCQFGLEGRLARLHEKEKTYKENKNAVVESSCFDNTLFGDLNQASCLYTMGFNRRYDISAIPNLLGAAFLSIATIPAQLLRLVWSVCCLVKAILPNHRTGAFDPLLENLSALAQAVVMATIGTALAIFKSATFVFTDGYQFAKRVCSKDAPPRKVLLIIDVQKDFENGGSLAVKDGDAVVDRINDFIKRIKDDPEWYVAVSQDWHPFNHKSFAAHSGVAPLSKGTLNGKVQMYWAAHCVQGSEGAKIDPRLNLSDIPKDRLIIVKKGFDKQEDSYSAFQGTRNGTDKGVRDDTVLHEHLKYWKVKEAVVVGLATDYCARYTAEDSVARKFKTSLIKEGCRGIGTPEDPGNCEQAYKDMQANGVKVVDSVAEYFTPA